MIRIIEEFNSSDITYHGTKSESSRNSIIESGFTGSSVFLSESEYDAEGYGRFIVRVYDINSLNLKEIVPGEDSFDRDNYSEYDGIKYRYDKYRPYNYEIYNILKLNKLKRD